MPGYRRVNLVLEQNPDLHALVTQALGAEWGERKVVDAYLIRWEPGAVTPYHDHGEAEGVIVVLAGRVFEEHYCKETKQQFGQRDVGWRGKTFTEGPRLIQRMGNAGDVPALSLHLFFKGPMTMTEYTEEEMRVGQ